MPEQNNRVTTLDTYARRIGEARGRQTVATLLRAHGTMYAAESGLSPALASEHVSLVNERAVKLENSTVSRPEWREWLREWGYKTYGPDGYNHNRDW